MSTLTTYSATTIANELIREHLTGWRFGLDRAKRRVGCCKYGPKMITVSAEFLGTMNEAEFRLVILHEIAHALAGHKVGHGLEWKLIARRIGGDGERTYKGGATAATLAPWQGVCPNGHTAGGKYRKPTATRSCGKCSPTFDRRYLITWRKVS